MGDQVVVNSEPVIGDRKTISVVRSLLTPDALIRAEAVQLETGEPLESVVTRLGLVSEQALALALSKAAHLPLVSARDFPAVRVEGASPSAAFLREMRALPLAVVDGRLRLALANPFDDFAATALGFSFAIPVDRVVAP